MKHARTKIRATRLPVQQNCFDSPRRQFSISAVLLNNENDLVPKLLELQNGRLQIAISKDAVRARNRSHAGKIFSDIRGRKKNAERGAGQERSKNQTALASMNDELASESLPRSPVMARVEQGSIASKAQAKGMAARRLAKNPWANMLASPLRMCNVTHARMPRDLLAPFEFVKDPTGSKTYLMPLAFANLDSLRQWKTSTSKNHVLKITDHVSETNLDSAKEVVAGARNTGSDNGREQRVTENLNVPSLAKIYEGYPQRPERSIQTVQNSPSQSVTFLIPQMSVIRYTVLAMDTRKPPSSELNVTPRLYHQRVNRLEPSDRKDGILWRRDMPELVASLLKKRLDVAMENVIQTKVDRYGVPLLAPLDDVESSDILQGAHTGAILCFVDKETSPEDIYAAFANRFPNAKRPLRVPLPPGLPQRNFPVLPLADDRSVPIFAIKSLLQQMPSGLGDSNLGFLGELRDLLQSDQSRPLSTWWLLRSSHASTVQAINEFWRLFQYVMYDRNTDELVAADAQRHIKWRRRDREES